MNDIDAYVLIICLLCVALAFVFGEPMLRLYSLFFIMGGATFMHAFILASWHPWGSDDWRLELKKIFLASTTMTWFLVRFTILASSPPPPPPITRNPSDVRWIVIWAVCSCLPFSNQDSRGRRMATASQPPMARPSGGNSSNLVCCP
ncbi:hypothetical protein OH76DRAFT_731076 [Lentinus brumalis]|uniref:Uncharacterized protein n=1 Tax=Lentinus brumalis TaxID=2498619 RepID=A0A371DRZ1_9APHY|nr:hypothetical protein OH76DRAFT_731076 [Polyporus brumalis]